MTYHNKITENMNQIYISIHETDFNSTLDDLSWRLLVQTTKPSSFFQHARKPDSTIYDPHSGAISGRKLTPEDQKTQILKVLINETRSADLPTQIHLALNSLSDAATPQHTLQRLQQNNLIRNFDLRIFTTVVEDRLRLVLRNPHRSGHDAEEMNYLAYCQTPADRSPAKQDGSEYFLSAYEEPAAKKSKKGFWITHGSGRNYRSAMSSDPYGGLM